MSLDPVGGAAPRGAGELSAEEQREVQALRRRDREVRQHEQAHLAAAGGHARGGAKYTFTRGPDGRLYATGGEVDIDTSKESTPEATLRKMEQVIRAALAAPQPSPQDRRVAAEARATAAEARREIAQRGREPGESGVSRIDLRG